MKTLKCKICKEKTGHNLINEVKFLTKWRILTKRTYKCSRCDNVKNINSEKKNKNVKILDG